MPTIEIKIYTWFYNTVRVRFDLSKWVARDPITCHDFWRNARQSVTLGHSPTSANQSRQKSTVLKLQLLLLHRYGRRGTQGARFSLPHIAYDPANGHTCSSDGLPIEGRDHIYIFLHSIKRFNIRKDYRCVIHNNNIANKINILFRKFLVEIYWSLISIVYWL